MIEIRNVSIVFNNKYLLKGLDYTIGNGAKILFNAPSGTGKTSFFRLLLGFLQPTEGEVYYDGKKLTGRTVKGIRGKIGYHSQEADLPAGKVREVINTILSYKANEGKNLNDGRLAPLLETFELGQDVLNKDVEELSGGERQRLLLIVLVLLEREVYLLDEPTSALDENLKIKVRDFFLELPATVLVISHDKVWLDPEKMIILDWTKNTRWNDGQ